ncbi:MAG: VOC family protein [Candidatus Eisenbacteria bacterium]|nr:hypothetical protein [Candidatus Eisenbacteria bacterium]
MRVGVSFYLVGDTKKATRIYSRLFETEPFLADGDWVEFSLEGGNVALHADPELKETNGADQTVPFRGGAIVSFRVPDVRAALDRALTAGFEQVGGLNVQPYGTIANLRDPWGNRLSVMEPPPVAP